MVEQRTKISINLLQNVKLILLVVRIVAVIWSAGMLTAVDSVGIITQGQVELESSRQIYNNILWAAFSSLLTEAAIKKIRGFIEEYVAKAKKLIK